MSHTSKSQESKRKHGKTPDGNRRCWGLLESIFLPQFVIVKDMNYTGEVLHGKWDGTYYVLDDGDCYTAERLADEYGAIFSDTDPAKEPS